MSRTGDRLAAPSVPRVGLPIPSRWRTRSEVEFGVVVISHRRARLLLFDATTVVEVVDARLPVRANPFPARADEHSARIAYARRIQHALDASVDPTLPLVLAGEPGAVASFLDLATPSQRVLAVLPGDHDETTPTALRALVLRRLRPVIRPESADDPQRRRLAPRTRQPRSKVA